MDTGQEKTTHNLFHPQADTGHEKTIHNLFHPLVDTGQEKTTLSGIKRSEETKDKTEESNPQETQNK